MNDKILVCNSCGAERPLFNGVITEPGINAVQNNQGTRELQKYLKETKLRYQSDRYSENYLDRYKRVLPKNYYHWFIARQERITVEKMLRAIPGSNLENHLVLDLPAGTGKLTPVHEKYSYNVIAADVSLEMLLAGVNEWEGCNLVAMIQSDITSTGFLDKSIDTTICLRLMHRLPEQVISEALKEIKRITKNYVLISNGVDEKSLAGILPYERSKRSKLLYSKNEWRAMLSSVGDIIMEFNVSRFISKEIITLVKVK